MASAKNASATPLFVTVIVQLNEPPKARLPLTSFVLEIVRSAGRVTVMVSAFEATPSTNAEAEFVMRPAEMSPAVTE